MRGGDEVGKSLLSCDASDEDRDRPLERDAVRGEYRGGAGVCRAGVPDVRVDPVVHHVHSGGIDRRVGVEHVGPHSGADRDDRVGVFHRVAFGPRRDPVSATQLLGLPGPTRLERVRRDDVRDVVESAREVPGETGVPGVRVCDVGATRAVRHPQLRRQCAQGGIGGGQVRVRVVDDGAVARPAHAVDVHLAQRAQVADQLGHVDTRAAVDLRGYSFVIIATRTG